MSIDIIKPDIFEDHNKVEAFFTLKNPQVNVKERSIEGLNLGFNTDEAPEIVKQNRQMLTEQFDLDPNWIAFANQVHNNRVKVVTGGGTFANMDALITQVPGLALAIQVADCAAILIADDEGKTIAAIHAGWRGAAGDIVPRTLEKMKQLVDQPANYYAFISPCISVENFEVGPEVAEQFPDEFVDYATCSKPHINLKGFLKDQLIQEGVSPENIEVDASCTVANERFYSYRREGDKSGRMMAVIKIKPNKR